ncbi:TetR/AcrR family transcriptional regulator [Pectobacterium actinidiae]|uniref:TetR/AcrR family transcriptional regulator n=1 Tax=Pectobacterium actinidiae TaxID=1507808 RepID=UPI00382F7255
MTPHPKHHPGTAKAKTAAASEGKKKRVRLTPEVRRQQILDAALIEFGALGFTAASIAKIATRAGTSKANLYVHFANKDEIFETLLRDLLVPANTVWSPTQPGQDVSERIDAFIDNTYDALTPKVVAVIRLLIAESHRIPNLIQRWHEQIMIPARIEQQNRIDEYVAAGTLRASPLTEYFAFVTAPLLYAAITRMVFREDVADSEYEKIKETHRKMLHFILKPQPEMEAPAGRKPRKGKA